MPQTTTRTQTPEKRISSLYARWQSTREREGDAASETCRLLVNYCDSIANELRWELFDDALAERLMSDQTTAGLASNLSLDASRHAVFARRLVARSQHDRAKEHFDIALAKARSARDAKLEARVLYNAALNEFERRCSADALALANAALLIYRAVSDLNGEAACVQLLGDIEFDQAHDHEAKEHYERALLLSRSLRSVSAEAEALSGLGEVLDALGAADEAERCLRDACVAYRATDWPAGIARCSMILGEIISDRGDVAAARELFADAAANYRLAGRESDARRCEALSA